MGSTFCASMLKMFPIIRNIRRGQRREELNPIFYRKLFEITTISILRQRCQKLLPVIHGKLGKITMADELRLELYDRCQSCTIHFFPAIILVTI